MDTVGKRVRALRDERGITQIELGRAVGVKQSTISEIERDGNDPSLPVLRKIAEYFEVRPGYFLDDEAVATVVEVA